MIQPLRLSDVRELAQSQPFQAWYASFREVQEAMAQARQRRDELTADSALVGFRSEFTQRNADETLYCAGEREDLSARAASEHAMIENDSFEVLSAYELQRARSREIWNELVAREGPLEDKRREASDLRAELEAARKGGGATEPTLEQRLEDAEREIAVAARELGPLRDRLTREEARKAELWQQEETIWSAAFRANLARSEYAFQAQRYRSRAEALYSQAASERGRVDSLLAQAKRENERLVELEKSATSQLAEAESKFGCVAIGEFLYWPTLEDLHRVYCVPLADEAAAFNIPVVALRIYQIDRDRGLERLEPVPEGSDGAGDDPRLLEFFSGQLPPQPSADDEPGAQGG